MQSIKNITYSLVLLSCLGACSSSSVVSFSDWQKVQGRTSEIEAQRDLAICLDRLYQQNVRADGSVSHWFTRERVAPCMEEKGYRRVSVPIQPRP